MANRRPIDQRTKKILYAKSGNKCAFPGCNIILVDNDTDISNICHIEGVNPGSARYNPSRKESQINDIDNLIVLCENHHRIIDQNSKIYTVEKLKEMKSKHEINIASKLSAPNIEEITSNPPKDFFTELKKIFGFYNFNEIFFETDFGSTFKSNCFFNLENGIENIKALLNEPCAATIESGIYTELLKFIDISDQLMTYISFGCRADNNCATPPDNNIEYRNYVNESMKELREIYIKYRFR